MKSDHIHQRPTHGHEPSDPVDPATGAESARLTQITLRGVRAVEAPPVNPRDARDRESWFMLEDLLARRDPAWNEQAALHRLQAQLRRRAGPIGYAANRPSKLARRGWWTVGVMAAALVTAIALQTSARLPQQGGASHAVTDTASHENATENHGSAAPSSAAVAPIEPSEKTWDDPAWFTAADGWLANAAWAHGDLEARWESDWLADRLTEASKEAESF